MITTGIVTDVTIIDVTAFVLTKWLGFRDRHDELNEFKNRGCLVRSIGVAGRQSFYSLQGN